MQCSARVLRQCFVQSAHVTQKMYPCVSYFDLLHGNTVNGPWTTVVGHLITCCLCIDQFAVTGLKTVQFNFVRNKARTRLCCRKMPANAPTGRFVTVARAARARTRAKHHDRASFAGRRDLLGPMRRELSLPSATAVRTLDGYHNSSMTTL